MEFKNLSKIVLLSTFLVCSSYLAISQDRLLKKAYIQVNESNWEDFNDKLNKYLIKGGEQNASYHYLMALYFQKSPAYDPVKWYQELMISFSQLKLIPQEEGIINCSTFNFCINNEKEEISKVVNVIYKEYENRNTIYFWKEFIDKYGAHSMELQYKAHKNIEELDFNNAISENSEAAYKKFIEAYPNASSERIDQAHAKWEELAYKRVISANSIANYNEFFLKFPNTNRKEIILKKIQEIEYQAVLKEAKYPNGKIDAIIKHLEKYPSTNNKTKLGQLYFKLISAGLNYNHNDVNLYKDFLQLFAINENQMIVLAELVKGSWDLPLMNFFIKEFPFYEQISIVKDNRKWTIETDSLISITERINSLATADHKGSINIPRYVKQTESGITIQTREKVVSLKNNIGEEYEKYYVQYIYNCFLPLFKEHKIYIGSYEAFETMFVAEKNGKKTTFEMNENFGANSIIFRHKKNIFFTTTTENYGDEYYFSIYSFKNGVITKVFNDELFFSIQEDKFIDKTNFSKTNRIKTTYTDDEGKEYIIEYEYSEENNTWKKIEDITASENAMERYIEKLVDSKKPIKIAGRSLNPENCKGKNHYSNYYKNYYNGVCYSSVYMTQSREINSLPINYKGLIYPIKLTDDNILIGSSSTEEHYYMEDYDEDELIFIDFKNAYNNKEIILPK